MFAKICNFFARRPFFWKTLAHCVLGLEHFCPWPREGLPSESRSLAWDFFFCVVGLMSSTPPLVLPYHKPRSRAQKRVFYRVKSQMACTNTCRLFLSGGQAPFESQSSTRVEKKWKTSHLANLKLLTFLQLKVDYKHHN